MHAETLTNIAKWAGIDKGDLSRAFAAAGVKPTVKGSAHLYPIDSAFAVVIEVKTGVMRGKNSADERNLAQAEKLRLETSIIRGNHVPVERGAAIIRRILTAISDVIASSDLPNEPRERLVERIHDTVSGSAAELRQEIESESDED
jgi:hypothetical protein